MGWGGGRGGRGGAAVVTSMSNMNLPNAAPAVFGHEVHGRKTGRLDRSRRGFGRDLSPGLA